MESQSAFEERRKDTVNQNDKTLSLIAHLGGILFGFIPSLIIYLMKKDESPFVADQSKEALNFQICVAIAYFISGILVFVLIGLLLIWVVYFANLIFCIIAGIKASNGEYYRYPVSYRFIK